MMHTVSHLVHGSEWTRCREGGKEREGKRGREEKEQREGEGERVVEREVGREMNIHP